MTATNSANTQFTEHVADFARSIQDFHDRWARQRCANRDEVVPMMARRFWMAKEEFEETERELDMQLKSPERAAHELADIMYVLLGTLEHAGQTGIDALAAVVAKNDAKTEATHMLHPVTGKVVRK